MLQRMRLTWDSVTYTWNQWVLGYTPERQRRFLSHLGFSEASWQTMSVVLMIFAGIAVLFGAALALRDLRQARPDAAKAAYDRFCRKLARRGLPRGAAEGPRVYAARAALQRPDLAPAIEDITALYVGLRYAGETDPGSLQALERRSRAFKA
jgi:hypothetical protein